MKTIAEIADEYERNLVPLRERRDALREQAKAEPSAEVRIRLWRRSACWTACSTRARRRSAPCGVTGVANKPLRPCLHPGCTALVRSGYCDKHRPPDTARRSAASRSYHRWYSLPIWTDELRPQQLAREPFCRDCARRGLRVYATDVDHVVPHDGDWSKFVDETNLQSLCHSCHSAKTIAESRAKAARRRR